jgi:hypothetical protein
MKAWVRPNKWDLEKSRDAANTGVGKPPLLFEKL